MDKIGDKVKELAGKKADNFGKPGNSVEQKADDQVNSREYSLPPKGR